MVGSIFQEILKNQCQNLWEKDKETINELQGELEDKERLQAFEFGKIVCLKGSYSINIRKFYLIRNFLTYQKNGVIKAYIDLNFSLFDFKNVENEQKDGFNFMMKIIKGNRFSELAVRDKQTIEKLRIAIKNQVIFTDFFERYSFEKSIGGGAFAQVKPLSSLFILKKIFIFNLFILIKN